jgi:hypothetical protein
MARLPVEFATGIALQYVLKIIQYGESQNVLSQPIGISTADKFFSDLTVLFHLWRI